MNVDMNISEELKIIISKWCARKAWQRKEQNLKEKQIIIKQNENFFRNPANSLSSLAYTYVCT